LIKKLDGTERFQPTDEHCILHIGIYEEKLHGSKKTLIGSSLAENGRRYLASLPFPLVCDNQQYGRRIAPRLKTEMRKTRDDIPPL
jgi:hypothetical protein